jgi:hypothetical protein
VKAWQNARIVLAAVIVAMSMNGDGRREILGLDTGPSSAETFRIGFLRKLAQAAERSWRRLKGYALLPKVILGEKFSDRIEVVSSDAQTAAG